MWEHYYGEVRLLRNYCCPTTPVAGYPSFVGPGHHILSAVTSEGCEVHRVQGPGPPGRRPEGAAPRPEDCPPVPPLSRGRPADWNALFGLLRCRGTAHEGPTLARSPALLQGYRGGSQPPRLLRDRSRRSCRTLVGTLESESDPGTLPSRVPEVDTCSLREGCPFFGGSAEREGRRWFRFFF